MSQTDLRAAQEKWASGVASDEMQRKIERLTAENERLRLFLSEIAAMGPADDEWDADTLEGAVALAKRAYQQQQPCQTPDEAIEAMSKCDYWNGRKSLSGDAT